MGHAPVHERILAAVRDPYLAGRELTNGLRKLVPIGMVGHHERHFDEPLAGALTTADLLRVYRDFYAGESFVRVVGEGERPTTRHVTGSNYCDVTVVADPRTGRAVCVSAIDNLGKGAGGAAVQNLNIMAGVDPVAGLVS